LQGGLIPPPDIAERVRELPESRGLDVKSGVHVELEPCLPAHRLDDESEFWRKQGRPCPYIGLSAENDIAATLVINHLHEHVQNLTPVLAASLLADHSPEARAAVLLRVTNALRSGPVVDRLFPKVPD
jgi:hypothetical protein